MERSKVVVRKRIKRRTKRINSKINKEEFKTKMQ
jgi:hypothetical protein